MATVLWKFQFSVTTSFVIEVGDLYMRFYAHGAPVYFGDVAYGIVTPYAGADVGSLQYKQINDVVYITHPDYPVHKLSRLGDTNWTLERVVFMQPPTLDENLTPTTITASGTNGVITLTASEDIFNEGHVDSYWRIGHLRESAFKEFGINSDFVTESMRILGDWEIHTYGVWSADLRVEKQKDPYSSGVYSETGWESVRKWSGRSDRNIDGSGTAETDEYYRIVCENYTAGNGGRAVLEAVDAMVYGVVKITGFTDAQHVTAETLIGLERTEATPYWQEAAFSDYRGHPRAVEIHEERLMFGGTVYQPQTVYGSVIGDYENFNRGTADDSSIVFTLAGQELNAIQWMVSQNDLLIGTTGSEWRVSSRSTEKPLTPSTITARKQTSYGSEYIQAVVVDGTILYVQRKGRKIRELVFSYDVDKFVSADLTLLAEHMTEGGVVQIAHQAEPIPILWCVTGAGALVGMTYARDQQVTGWHRHPIDGIVESVTTIYGEDDADDEVWLIVRRTINGEEVRYVEQINPEHWSEKEDGYFVDCGLSYDGVPADEFSGLEHLEGRSVVALADGKVVTGLTVTGGSVTLPFEASKVHIGLSYESRIAPMRLDSDQQLGVIIPRTRRVAGLHIRVRNTLGITYENEEKTYKAALVSRSEETEAATELFTGDKELQFHGELNYDSLLLLKQSNPLPFTLQCIVPKYEVTGK
jgi:hypothetical protein